MKKSLVSALTAAVVLGTMSTTFATPTDAEVAELRARIAELERIIQQQNNSSRREVNNLDSRVTDLEKSGKNSLSERFNIGGELRWSYWNRYKNPDASNLQLRLVPTFKIDDHLTIRARFRGTHNTQNDSRVLTRMDLAYVDARFGKVQANIGKVPLYTDVDRGLFADTDFTGVQFLTGDRNKFTVNLGNWSDYAYAGVEARFNTDQDLTFGAGYHYSKQQDVTNKEKVSVITGGIGYKFNPDLELFGAVAHNTEANNDKTAYNVELDYKGANRNVKSSWGVYAAYRYAPSTAARAATYNTFGQDTNKKGFEVGATWTPYKSIVTDLSYFHGKYFGGGDDRTFFARARAFF